MPILTAPVIEPGSLSRSDQPSIHVGEVAVLRPWTVADAPAVSAVFGDAEIQRWHVRSVDSLTEAQDLIDGWRSGWSEESDLNWALADPTGDAVLGRLSLKDVNHRDGSAELAYWMVPAARGRGLCPRAVEALCRWAFDEAGFHRIEAEHSTRNQSSYRVLVKSGFRQEGTRRRAALHADGWHDMHLHALLANDLHDSNLTHRSSRPS